MHSVDTNSRKRRRVMATVLFVSALSTTVNAWVGTTPSSCRFTSLQATNGIQQETVAAAFVETRVQQWKRQEDEFDYNFYDDDEDEYDLEDSVDAFKQLKKSMGSDVLPADVLERVKSVTSPKQFLEFASQDASELEKIAMASVVEQLPQKLLQAYLSSSKETKHEVELELARQIQKGVTLHKIRRDLLLQLDREPSKQEWASAAKLSPKELRRQVVLYRRAKHNLVSANMGLVHAVVKQEWANRGVYYKQSGMTKQELLQEGALGLLRAAELFDPNRGLRFSTYAVVWIKGTLQNSHAHELVRLPSREKTKWNKILKAQRDVEKAGETATAEELAAITGLSVAEVMTTQRRMKQAQNVLSLDYEYSMQSRSGATATTSSAMEGRKDPAYQDDADLAERTQLQADLIMAMARNLDDREARLVRLRYGLSDGRPRTLHECAEAMGLSYTRVQQLSQASLKKLRKAAEAESLEEYFLTIA